MPRSARKVNKENSNQKLSFSTPAQKKFINFTPQDARVLKGLKKVFAPEVRNFVELFYRHLLGFSQTRSLLADLETIARLKKSQTDYFLSLFDGDYGQKYVETRLKIGQV